jgi:UPF0755 protein
VKKWVALTVAVLLVFVAGVGVWTFDFLYSSPGVKSETVIYEVKPGDSFGRVAFQLEAQDLIKDLNAFKILGRVLGYTSQIRVGEYELNRGMRPLEILSVLSSGKSIERPITFKEGLNMYEIAQALEDDGFFRAKDFLSLCKNKQLIEELLGEPLPSLEGYLFPETYRLTKYTTAEQLVRLMVQNFFRVYEQAEASGRLKKPRHEAVILASIIEKETGAPEERPMISSVFHNRLRLGMRLQSDPTILYGMLVASGVMPKNIRKKDIRAPTPFNTYTVNGLPFGPIANPGEEALKAALSPEASNYLYFVSRNDGTHVFSTSLKDHNRAVRKFQLDKKMREGRSWRDLNSR